MSLLYHPASTPAGNQLPTEEKKVHLVALLLASKSPRSPLLSHRSASSGLPDVLIPSPSPLLGRHPSGPVNCLCSQLLPPPRSGLRPFGRKGRDNDINNKNEHTHTQPGLYLSSPLRCLLHKAFQILPAVHSFSSRSRLGDGKPWPPSILWLV